MSHPGYSYFLMHLGEMDFCLLQLNCIRHKFNVNFPNLWKISVKASSSTHMLTFNLSFLLNSLYIKRNIKVFYIHINNCDNI